jgi:hypothetical protein
MSLPDTAASRSRLLRAAAALVLSSVLIACSGPRPSAAPPATPSLRPTEAPTASADPQPTAVDPSGVNVDDVPTACYGLGEQDCRRVSAHVATLLPVADRSVPYIQVGPFGCLDGQRCATTLAARPEGDVTFESAGGAARSFHVKVTDGILDAVRQEAFGISLPPTSLPPVPGARQPFTLGHCGLWSGVDVGGSWWDPVGFVDADHGDSINAAEGTIAFIDPDHAVFTSSAGLIVQLLRRDGDKFLPMCG